MQNQKIPVDTNHLHVMTCEQELRRSFSMQGVLVADEQQFIIYNVPPACRYNSEYLRSLVVLVYNSYNYEQIFSFFVFHGIVSELLLNLFDYIFKTLIIEIYNFMSSLLFYTVVCAFLISS